jgi:hypothetical protein
VLFYVMIKKRIRQEFLDFFLSRENDFFNNSEVMI